MPLRLFEKGENLAHRLVLRHHGVLRHPLHETQETSFGVEPRVRLEFDVVGLEGFDDPRDAELVVALGAVQRPDDEVDDAQVEAPTLGILRRRALLLLLDPTHQLLRLLVLTRHDVRHAQVREHDGRHVEHVLFQVRGDDGLVEPNRLAVFFLVAKRLHEIRVRHVQSPRLVLPAKLRALFQDAFHLLVVFQIPVHLRLRRERGDVRLERVVVLRHRAFDLLRVPSKASVLHFFRQPSELVRVLSREMVVLAIGFLGGGLRQDGGVEVFVEIRGEVFCDECLVLRHDVGGEVVKRVLGLAVQQEKVAERLRRERR